ncbi:MULTISPECIES: hypothetical protein [Streptomyces]|uniref:Uncharacterized protein n=2 Tax=Streptomyces rimosus subsp. rimosus TaxID=132474 RepID=A0A8A1USB9_STRR1|nr:MULTISPECIES: hypothetical protein [Streptomyces]MYT47305.1 hypothetical protein [Streptomyces sp. SID5471]QGY64758.1 hypothetical protein V519_001585 [Streptomyces rimosus R6-500]QST81692.1 hypothetical protein SRIM_017370 [Streptomyces rimosus subsp. rimosus ATCC 10970]UNZ05132.1 hypothetical protein SRIMR7_23530 [Streptomyces rimosus subsp. rimosus]UTH96586.1 hypothetical protein SRIMHP_20895 [Streptomyces rimosus subsp. rimosus]
MSKRSEAKQARETYKVKKAEHNARFNNTTTDPDSEEYLASNAAVADAGRRVSWLRRR